MYYVFFSRLYGRNKICKTCAVSEYKSTAYKDPNLSFHHFPKDDALRKKWLSLCMIENIDNPVLQGPRVCINHSSKGDNTSYKPEKNKEEAYSSSLSI